MQIFPSSILMEELPYGGKNSRKLKDVVSLGEIC
jgi:hypothetical protein